MSQTAPADSTAATDELRAEITDIRKRTLLEKWEDFLYGYDFFVAYRWADGRDYAVELAGILRKEFSCFLDTCDYAAGDSLASVGNRAVKKTSRLILVATQGVADSAHVKRELRVFRSTGRRVVAIEFEGSVDALKQADSEFETLLPSDELRIQESPTALCDGPSPGVVSTVKSSLLTELKRKRRRIAIVWAVAALLVLTGLTVASSLAAKRLYAHKVAALELEESFEAEITEDESDNTVRVAIDNELGAEGTTDVDVERLVECLKDVGVADQVVRLEIIRAKLTNCSEFGELTNLRFLNLYNSTGLADLSFTRRLPNLEALHLNGINISDEVFRTLTLAGNLREVTFSNNSISAGEVARIIQANSNLATIRLYECDGLKIDASLASMLRDHAGQLKRNRHLFSLELHMSAWMTGSDSEFIGALFRDMRNAGHRIDDGSNEHESVAESGEV